MHTTSTLRRVIEAIASALGVVLGLVPDPTLIPIPVEMDEHTSSRSA